MNVKLELTSDNDIFFLYQTVVNEDKYKSIQESQGLQAEFSDFHQILLKMLGNVSVRSSSSYIGCVTMDLDAKKAIIDFLQDTEYRRVELLRIELDQCDEETVKNLITYRISSTKQKTTLM